MLTAQTALDLYYLDTRCLLLEIAAMLDRHDAAAERDGGTTAARASRDRRLEKIYQSLALLAQRDTTPDRCERLLNLFSDLD